MPIDIYTFTFKIKADVTYLFRVYYEDGTYSSSGMSSIPSDYISMTVTTLEKKIDRIALGYSSGTASSNIYIKDFMLNRGATSEAYVPYIEPNVVSLPLGDIELRSIPETERDTFERVNGVWNKVTRIESYTPTGEENWWQQGNSATYGRRFDCAVSDKPPAKYGNCLCSHAPYIEANKGGVWVGTYPAYSYLALRFQTLDFESTADFKTWLASNPVQYDYVLATPTYTPITDEALVQALDELEQLVLHKGYNRITVTGINGVKAYLDLEIHPTASVTKIEETEISIDMIVPVVSGDGDVIPKIPKENQMTLNPSTGLLKVKDLEVNGEKIVTQTELDEAIENTIDEAYVDEAIANISASDVKAGTFPGSVKAYSSPAVGTAQIRNIYAGTTDLVAGTSTLATGTIYLVYE